MKLTYSQAFERNGLIKWQAGGQYIHFRSNSYYDQFSMENSYGPYVDVVNSEQALVLNGGLRLSASKGLFSKGNFKPYIGGSVGLAFFSETTKWDWGNSFNDDCSLAGWILDLAFDTFDCGDDVTSISNTLDSRVEPIFSIDIGGNLYFKENHKTGLDFGIRYNMVTGLKRPQTQYDLSDDDSGILENTHAYISKRLQADYYTWYIGVSVKLDKSNRSKRKEEKKRRRQGKLI